MWCDVYVAVLFVMDRYPWVHHALSHFALSSSASAQAYGRFSILPLKFLIASSSFSTISSASAQAFTQMTDYMTSAASKSANTEQLSSVPYAPLGNISSEIQACVTTNVVDDSGFGFAYGSCKLLDMLGYGSFIVWHFLLLFFKKRMIP